MALTPKQEPEKLHKDIVDWRADVLAFKDKLATMSPSVEEGTLALLEFLERSHGEHQCEKSKLLREMIARAKGKREKE